MIKFMCLIIILFINYERILSLNILIYSFTYKFMLLILSSNIINSHKKENKFNIIILFISLTLLTNNINIFNIIKVINLI